jgi:competence protein ComEC
MLSGAAWVIWSADSALDQRLDTQPTGTDRVVTGRVVGLPVPGPDRIRFVFARDAIEGQQDLPPRMLINWYRRGHPQRQPAFPQAAERWRLALRLRGPRGQSNPGGFDYELWLLRQRIGATGYVRESELNRRLGRVEHSWATVRDALADAVARALPASPRTGMIEALLVGSGTVSAEQRRLLQQTGTAHLMAISGLHVGIAAAFGAVIGRFAWRLLPLRWLGVRQSAGIVGALISAFSYAGLAGFQLPTRRALVMTVVVMIMLARRRAVGPWAAYSTAMMAVLMADPLATMGPGFWLSFGAVAGLLLVAPALRGAGLARGMLGAQLSVSVALAPAVVAIYAQLPLLSPLANLVAVPLFTVLFVPLVLVAGMASMIWFPLAAALFGIADAVLAQLLALLSWLVAVGPGALLPAQAPPSALLAAVPGALLALLAGAGSRMVAASALLLPLLFWQGSQPGRGGFELTVLDVGQGLAAVVRTRQHTLVFDTGPAWAGGDSGSRNLVPFLRAVGVGEVDLLVVSHPDLDHRGGVPGLIDGLRVRRVAGSIYPGMPMPMPDDGACRRGQAWSWDEVDFRFVHPPGITVAGGNNDSCVLRVAAAGGAGEGDGDSDGTTVLLTGDIEAGAERQIIAAAGDLDVDLVVAPHHGSRTSSSAEFVAATGPRWVIYPAGYGNRWRFPHVDVLRRWGAAQGLVTGQHGAVTVVAPGDGLQPRVVGWRCQARRFWRWRECDPA